MGMWDLQWQACDLSLTPGLWSSVSHPVPPLLRTSAVIPCLYVSALCHHVSCKYLTLNRVTSYCSGTVWNTTNYALPGMITTRKLIIIRKITAYSQAKHQNTGSSRQFQAKWMWQVFILRSCKLIVIPVAS